MLILGIETSCDETAAAVLEVTGGKFKVKSNVVNSQITTHRKFGGVVPEVAARQHTENILPVIGQALTEAKVTLNDIDKIAVTRGPGLVTSLLVGLETAKTLAYAYQKPLYGINHLEGHILVNLLPPNKPLTPKSFPVICLIVSGGHTEIVLMRKIGSYQVVGQTLDDAAGECFDKAAKILKLGYPGGPAIAAKAKNGNAEVFKLPRPLLNQPNLDFSFSGLKTAILYWVQKNGRPRGRELNDFCASIEQSIIDVLVHKTVAAAKKYRVKTILIGGGVTVNTELRRQLAEAVKAELPQVKYQAPNILYCTDNALLAAMAGVFAKKTDQQAWKSLIVDPNLEL